MAEEAKKSSPWKWILIIFGGCFLLSACCCLSCVGLTVINPEFKDSFEESYCTSLEDQGMNLSEDPLNICNR